MHRESICKVLNHAPLRWRRCGGKCAQWLHQNSGRQGGVAGKLVADVSRGLRQDIGTLKDF